MKRKENDKGRKGKAPRRNRVVVPLIAITGAAFLTASAACTTMSRKDFEGERKMRIEESKNNKAGKFINQAGKRPLMKESTWSIMKKMFFGDQQAVPKEPLTVNKVDVKELTGGGADELKVTWLGHSFTIIELEGSLILTDPMLGKRPSPVPFIGPKRYHKNLPLILEELPEIDLVLISHDHYDHLDHESINRIHKKVKRFVVPLGVGAYLEKWGVESEKITELDWWQQTTTGKGLKIAATPAQHFSGRKMINGDDTLWASFAIIGKKQRVFFSGDSGYNTAFKEIGFEYGPFDVTLMENGQYNKAWEFVHMLPEQSLQAHIDVQGKVMIPIHWGAYNLSIHDWTEPVERLLKAAAGKKVQIATPRIGETWKYGEPLPVAKWWPDIVKKKKVAQKKTTPATVALSEK